jgi:tetratricopeptide (TPR) repeat protein
MKSKITPPDTHYLSAAIGWMGLGVADEAEAELNRISAGLQTHPDVLEVRWMILAQTRRWDAALKTARTLLDCAPNRSSGWLHQAYSLRRVTRDGLQQAWKALLPAYEKFPREPTIPYNLSCYACQMNQLEEARAWLRRAFKFGDREKIKQMALDDPDLEPLWSEIRAL